MSGKHLLDFISIWQASSSVASKAVGLQRHQLRVYQRTSSLSQALNKGFNNANRTTKSSIILSNRSGEALEQPGSQFTSKPIPDRSAVAGKPSPLQRKDGIRQDHFYEASEANSSAHPGPQGSLKVKQEREQTPVLPDGTISPCASEVSTFQDSDPESRIPRQVADPPPSGSSNPNIIHDPAVGLRVDQKQDVFYSPSGDSSSVESALPKVKVSKHAEREQGGNELVRDEMIDQDVYYSPAIRNAPGSVTPTQAVPERQKTPKNIYSELFRSPKVAKMLSGNQTQNPSQDGKRPTRSDHATIPQEIPKTKIDYRSFTLQGTEAQATRTDDGPSGASEQSEISQKMTTPQSDSLFQMHESRVPSTRAGRLWEYGGLATSMAFGAVSEGFRRATGSGSKDGSPILLNGANMERLVSKLSRMRGAALKLGQMISFQDSKMLPAQIHEVLQRVQDRADYMPASQRNRVLEDNLGPKWRDLFSSFDEVPLAAASIGQVHGATLNSTGQRVAVKVQYPGVSNSIDSDLNNLSLLLTASSLLPKGLYLDKTIANARTELSWECDYVREAEGATRFRKLLSDDTNTFVVPKIIHEASAAQVLTMERMEGIAVSKMSDLSQDLKDWIGTNILRLCLREIIEFRYMQTDPNWTNFLYNHQTQKLELLDFGACREYPDRFIDPYIQILLAASRHDKTACRDLSIQLGYLTGHESRSMLEAHVQSVLTLAEPFTEGSPDVYDFSDQTITDRIRSLIPVMVRERLAPPPEETYSLHRKLSGAFLLCAKLGSRVRGKNMFANAFKVGAVE